MKATKQALQHANSAIKPDYHEHVETAPERGKTAHNAMLADSRRFRDALAKADALILARGGSVPNGYHFADWQERRERMLQHGT